MFWAAGTLATQADRMPRHWVARVIAVLWLFTAVVFIALYTAQLTATLTVRHIQGAINSTDDLPGRRVGTARQHRSGRRPPWPAATRDWCCAKSAANIGANDPRH
jgi:hypothetical protein